MTAPSQPPPEPPDTPRGPDRFLEGLERFEARQQVLTRIIFGFLLWLTPVVGVIFAWLIVVTPELQTPAVPGAVGVVLGLIQVLRTYADKRRPPKDMD